MSVLAGGDSFLTLPANLPVPQDDGACDHLTGRHLPSLELGYSEPGLGPQSLRDTLCLTKLPRRAVIFCYPRTGQPGRLADAGWDRLPGARGCTPQCTAFGSEYRSFQNLGYEVFGLSTQSQAYHRELLGRLELPYALLSDARLLLTRALNLPHFEWKADPEQNENPVLLRRMAWVVHEGRIVKVFYPVFPPNQNASTVLAWLQHKGPSNAATHGPCHMVHEQRGKLLLSNEAGRQQPQRVLELLRQSSWAQNRSPETIATSLIHANSYGIFDLEHDERQVALARVVTDYATFAYLCDVVVDRDYRGQGLSKWMMEAIVAHPSVATLKRFLLVTRDAHGLYERYGFLPLPADRAQRFMEILNSEA